VRDRKGSVFLACWGVFGLVTSYLVVSVLFWLQPCVDGDSFKGQKSFSLVPPGPYCQFEGQPGRATWEWLINGLLIVGLAVALRRGRSRARWAFVAFILGAMLVAPVLLVVNQIP
jgi:hypothetical protein